MSKKCRNDFFRVVKDDLVPREKKDREVSLVQWDPEDPMVSLANLEGEDQLVYKADLDSLEFRDPKDYQVKKDTKESPVYQVFRVKSAHVVLTELLVQPDYEVLQEKKDYQLS